MNKKWGTCVKKGLLFFAIFLAGSITSGFYFTKQAKPNITISGFPALKQRGYTLVYDGRAKLPLWTYERLNAKQLAQNVKRKGMHFYENPKIYPVHRSTLTDYYHSGFDRGHMVPARDQQVTKDHLKETFLLSNVCPQHPDLNRGFWKKLEKHARDQISEYESVEVISGPLFLPKKIGGKKVVRYQVIGPNDVAVPTHFYKIILGHTPRRKSTLKAYIVPNSSVDPKAPLARYEVTLIEIEKATGLVFETAKDKKTVISMLEESI